MIVFDNKLARTDARDGARAVYYDPTYDAAA
jgi:hypothetical protein